MIKTHSPVLFCSQTAYKIKIMLTLKASTQRFSRKVHKILAPIMVLPLILTAITGVIFQLFAIAGQARSARWLMALHRGDFGLLDLTTIYPFLNGIGLIVLSVTGLALWLQKRRPINA